MDDRIVHMTGFARALLLAVVLATVGSTGVPAQQIQAVVAVVNDEIISLLDIDQRVAMDTGGASVPPQVLSEMRESALQTIIDERLQIQEATRVNPSGITDAELEEGMARMRGRSNMNEEQFETFLVQAGIQREAFESRVTAETLWSFLVNARLGPEAGIPEVEVDAAYARIVRRVGQPEHLLSEIFVPVDFPDEEISAYEQIQIAWQALETGQPFEIIARTMSRGTTAQDGGDIDWIPSGALAADLEAEIRNLEIGSYSEPLRGPAGYYIFHVRNRQTLGEEEALGDVFDLMELAWKIPAIATSGEIEALNDHALQMRENVEACDDMIELANADQTSSLFHLGDVRFAELPIDIRDPVIALDIGEVTPPVSYEGMISLFSLCSREAAPSPIPTRDQIENQLYSERMNALARGYLRDLRATAIIDLR